MNSSAASDDSSLRVIVGPTGAGKSQLALALCERFRGAIVSADSRQVYRGFDIGTAKPTAAERARVPHYGVDVADASERWSAARFADEAATWLEACTASGRIPVVVGGTGLWLNALVRPLAQIPSSDPTKRHALEAFITALGPDRQRAWCAALDPIAAGRGPAQWRRAIEVALLTGRRVTWWQIHHTPPSARSVRYLLVDPGTALEDRIAARVDAMLAAGWEQETRHLMATVSADAPAWKACGYGTLRDAIGAVRAAAEGGEAVIAATAVQGVRDAIVLQTRQYARRQRTWFRRQLQHGKVTHLNPDAHDAFERACAWWRGDTHA